MNDELEKVKGELNNLRQRKLERNLIIKGLPERKDESTTDLENIVQESFHILNVVSVTRLTEAKRIGRIIDGKPRLVLITLSSLEVKQEVLRAKKKMEMTAEQIIVGGTALGRADAVIYIDEHLTSQTAFLLKSARELKAQYGLQYVWVKNGNVYIKKSDKTRALLLRNVLDVEAFKSKHRKRKLTTSVDSQSDEGDDTDNPVNATKAVRSNDGRREVRPTRAVSNNKRNQK